ncbi:hypothetical protein Y1Q_0000022 [Alligator mississippiensis]|uniref:Uncharacterized protein n=1 Tax=Alligator mississippiensis TaxID=8496 RepID=A0A151NTF6_ALLMI|nr:hypothetical protein Y1Q_0000022 [Alligator mississippiensis]
MGATCEDDEDFKVMVVMVLAVMEKMNRQQQVEHIYCTLRFPECFLELEIIPFPRSCISHLLIAISHCQLGPGELLKS